MRFLIILSLLVLASCSKKEAEPVGPTGAGVGATQAPAEAEATAEAPSEPPEAKAAGTEPLPDVAATWGELGVTTLLTPGEAPLGKHRRTFKKGDSAEVELQVTGSSEDTPPVGARYLVALETKSVSTDGSKATIGLKVEGASPIGQADDQLAQATHSRLEGIEGSYMIDSSGVITDFELVLPPEIAKSSRVAAALQGLRRFAQHGLLSIPVPAEEVGVGARWTFVETLDNDSVLQKTTYQITKIEGSRLEVSISSQVSSVNPTLVGTVKHLGAWGAGKGEASFDLAGIVPVHVNRDAEKNDKYFIVGKGPAVVTLNFAYKMSSQ